MLCRYSFVVYADVTCRHLPLLTCTCGTGDDCSSECIRIDVGIWCEGGSACGPGCVAEHSCDVGVWRVCDNSGTDGTGV